MPKITDLAVCYFHYISRQRMSIFIAGVMVMLRQIIKSIESEKMELELKNGTLITVNDEKIKQISNYFLDESLFLESIKLPNVTTIGYRFNSNNKHLKDVHLPLVTDIDKDFLYSNKYLQFISLPKIKFMGEGCFVRNRNRRALLSSIRSDIAKNENNR